jgi:hypothetical protein
MKAYSLKSVWMCSSVHGRSVLLASGNLTTFLAHLKPILGHEQESRRCSLLTLLAEAACKSRDIPLLSSQWALRLLQAATPGTDPSRPMHRGSSHDLHAWFEPISRGARAHGRRQSPRLLFGKSAAELLSFGGVESCQQL